MQVNTGTSAIRMIVFSNLKNDHFKTAVVIKWFQHMVLIYCRQSFEFYTIDNQERGESADCNSTPQSG